MHAFSCTGSPLPPQITNIVPDYWTADIHWVHNTTCFERCKYVVEWKTFSAMIKASTFQINRLEPGQHYQVYVTAQCTMPAPSHELRLSTKSTREFKTKGMSPIIIHHLIYITLR